MSDKPIEKKKRVRSPNYPAINLEEALRKAKVFYDEEDRHQANIEVAVKHWGYKNAAAGGALIIAALTSFGLMEDEGSGSERRVRLSPMGLRLVMDGSPSKQKDLEVAALSPKIHQELWELWGASLPSLESMRFYLLSERAFNRGSVDTFIEEYRHTLTFAGLIGGAKIPSTPTIKEEEIHVGDYVTWETLDNNEKPRKVLGFLGDSFVTVEGVNGTIPLAGLTKADPPESEKGGKGANPKLPQKLGMNTYTCTLDSGDAIIQWPKNITDEDLELVEIWLETMKKKIKRSVRQTGTIHGATGPIDKDE